MAALVHHVYFVLAGVVRLDREGKGLEDRKVEAVALAVICLLYTSPSPRDLH